MPTQQKFEMPKGVIIEADSQSATYAKMTAEPFAAGFGHTLGNALRRVLLSSLEGAAITTAKIDGVAHEFATIPGVYEDVTHIILNLKKVLFNVTTRTPFACQVKAKGPTDVTAGMISVPAGVEILNPDHHICSLGEKSSVSMEFTVEVGRGYRPAELNKAANQSIGVIPIDSLFSPVSKVKYAVEAARVGMKTDYDRLVLEVWSDGRIDPVAATVQSSQLLLDHVELFHRAGDPRYLQASTAEEESEVVEAGGAGAGGREGEAIEDLGFSKRTTNALVKAGVATLSQVLQKSERELIELRNFGEKAKTEIAQFLQERGLSLKREPATDDEIAALMKKSAKRSSE
jgi:DNA-directed RNA polymerase subunit alpha